VLFKLIRTVKERGIASRSRAVQSFFHSFTPEPVFWVVNERWPHSKN